MCVCVGGNLQFTSAEARNRSSKSKVYPAPLPTNTNRFFSASEVPAPTTIISSLDDDVMPVSPDRGPTPATGAGGPAPLVVVPLCLPLILGKMQHINSNNRSTSNNAAPTIAIATIAPFDNLFLCDFLTGVSSDEGPGDGEGGKNVLLQGGRGEPQRSRFPAKAETGNPLRDLGIDPFSLLSDTLNCWREMLMLGSVPFNWFPCKRRTLNNVRLFIENGIGPVRALSDRSSRESLPRFPIAGEISPVSSFSCK